MKRTIHWLSNALTAMLVLGLVACVSPFQGAIQQQMEASVLIENTAGGASGVFIAPTLVLTARHVADIALNPKDPMWVTDRKGHKYKVVEVSAPATAGDIAILLVDKEFSGATMEVSCRLPDIGERLHSIGNPYVFFQWFYTELIVAGYQSNYKRKNNELVSFNGMVLFQGVSLAGQSGSPMYDADGYVLGVLSVGWDTDGRGGPSGIGGFVSTASVCDWLSTAVNEHAHVVS